MRRKDREMPADFAYMVTSKCEWAVMSMIDLDGAPYSVPITIASEGEKIYIHSGPAGLKVDCLRANPAVCLVCVGDTYRLKDKFTTEFESAIIRGKAVEVTDRDEKIYGLRLLSQRHTPDNMGEFDQAIEASLGRTGVWRIDVLEITGKRKKYDKNGEEMKFGRME